MLKVQTIVKVGNVKGVWYNFKLYVELSFFYKNKII
jgi:hypothetical protein